MRFCALLLLLGGLAMAQNTPPKEVDEALRGRVNEFFGYHVTGDFRKAYDLVAEDTKEYYFAAEKHRFISFKIVSITYLDNFTKANVRVDGERKIRVSPQFPETVMVQPMTMTWVVENGKWCWHVNQADLKPTPMSNGPNPTPVQAPELVPDATPKLPDLSPEALKDRANQILKQSGVDKPNLFLGRTKESTERVTFHNGQAGGVRVYLDPGPPIEGFTAKISKTDLAAGEDAIITLHFTPGKEPPPGVAVRLTVEPLGQIFPIVVKFAN